MTARIIVRGAGRVSAAHAANRRGADVNENIKTVLAEAGIIGKDADTAYAAYLMHPNDSDGIRVKRVLETAGMI